MKINVLGFTYNVVRGYVQGRCSGNTDHVKQVITLDSSMDFDNTVETLMHEIIHCLEYAMNFDIEEDNVWRISRGLFSVLEDPQNQPFWAALAGSDEIMEEEEGYVTFDPDEVLEVWGDGDPDSDDCDNGDDLETPNTCAEPKAGCRRDLYSDAPVGEWHYELKYYPAEPSYTKVPIDSGSTTTGTPEVTITTTGCHLPR